jgi:N-acetylglucosamine-binding protein A
MKIMMNTKHIKTLAYAIALLSGGVYSTHALAHGALVIPSSRAVQYYGAQWPATEIEGLKLPAGGLMEADTPYENQFTFPPDGKIASGNKAERAALDNESYPWVSQPMHSGVQNFEWFFGQFHRTTYFTYYITKQDWKTKPGYGQRLTAEMFESQPFCHHVWPMSQPIPSPSPTSLTHVCNVPERTGEQKIYAAWRIRDTDKAFYQLVDVKFDGDSTPGGDTEQQKPVIHLANDTVVVDQSSANAGYTLDASGTQYATGYVWEVISGYSNFQLQEKQSSITTSRLEGPTLNAPRAWVAANHTGTGVYRVTASNQYGSITKDITVEVKAKQAEQKPVIHVANERIVVNQSAANAGYAMDASGTQYATDFTWEVIQGFGNFQLQEKQGAITSQRLTGPTLSTPRAWVAANHSGTGVYRVTASNKYGSVSKDITVEVKASDNGNGEDTGAAPAYDSHTKYDVPCTKVSHNSKIWQNQWYLNAGQEEPGTNGQWGGWRELGASNNSCK